MSYFHNNEGTPKRFLGFKITTKAANKLENHLMEVKRWPKKN